LGFAIWDFKEKMSFRQKIKVFQRTLARQGMYFSYWLIKILPYGLVKRVMQTFLFIGFQFTIRHKKVARESLRLAFGNEKSQTEREEILKKCFENFGWGMIEMIYFLSHPAMVSQKVTIEGKEHLDKAYAQGKGVIAVSAHFGNFPLMYLKIAQDGYKTSAIIRPARDQETEKFLFNERLKCGIRTVYSQPRLTCVNETLRSLKEGHVLFVLLDQHFGSGGGIFVDFFGRKAATATGPVVLARRTGAAIVPMFMIREKGDHYRILIEPAFELEDRANEEEMLLVNVSKITQIIERYIRKYPHEWGWMHRRWKGESEIAA
jgi:KDO2-lipid IV(A) lauroyltransferase